jgi:hypothetical protein
MMVGLLLAEDAVRAEGEHPQQHQERNDLFVLGVDERRRYFGCDADRERAEHCTIRLAGASEEHRGEEQHDIKLSARRHKHAGIHREDRARETAEPSRNDPGGRDNPLRAHSRVARQVHVG